MKLTTKQIMLIIMSTLLVLAIVMGAIVLNRVSGFLSLLTGSGSTTAATEPSAPSASVPVTTLGTDATDPLVTTEPTEPHEHNFTKSKTVSATCTDYGYTVYACSCGKQKDVDIIDPKGHILGATTEVLRTCEHDGYTEQMCSRCNQPIRTNVQKAKHTFGSWRTGSNPSVNAQTQKYRVCTICSCIEIRDIEAPDKLAIRRHVSEAYGSYSTYKVIVDLPDSGGAANEYTYQIYNQLADQTVHFSFAKSGSNKGLTITYSVNGTQKTYTAAVKNNTIIAIDSKGNVTSKTPVKDTVPTTPTTPPTEPSVPSTEPSITPTNPVDTTPAESTGTTPPESTTENTEPQA